MRISPGHLPSIHASSWCPAPRTVSRVVSENADGASKVAKTAGMGAHKAEELKASVAGFWLMT